MKLINLLLIILALSVYGCQRTYDTQADDTEYYEQFLEDHKGE